MKVMYLNGEKVYVDHPGRLSPENHSHLFGKKLDILRHSEVVRALNCMFKYAVDHPDEIGDDLTRFIYDHNLLTKNKDHRMHVDLVDIETTLFDNERLVKLAQRKKQAELDREIKVSFDHGLKLVVNNCRIPESPKSTTEQGDILTTEFKEWRKQQDNGEGKA